MKSYLFTVHYSHPTIVAAKAAANYENVIKIELAKDMREAPMQINSPIPLFITAALRTGISNLAATGALQADEIEEENPPPPSFLCTT